jgi:hypothetical protein
LYYPVNPHNYPLTFTIFPFLKTKNNEKKQQQQILPLSLAFISFLSSEEMSKFLLALVATGALLIASTEAQLGGNGSTMDNGAVMDLSYPEWRRLVDSLEGDGEEISEEVQEEIAIFEENQIQEDGIQEELSVFEESELQTNLHQLGLVRDIKSIIKDKLTLSKQQNVDAALEDDEEREFKPKRMGGKIW